MKFEFFVMNEKRNDWGKIEPFNIFNNCIVQRECEKAVRKYLRAPSKYKRKYEWNKEYKDLVGFDAFVREIDTIIACEELYRCEYEIVVGSLFMKDPDKELHKIDCYQQAKPNMVIIAHEIIRQYKEQVKKEKHEEI